MAEIWQNPLPLTRTGPAHSHSADTKHKMTKGVNRVVLEQKNPRGYYWEFLVGANKSCENLLFCLRCTFYHLNSMQKYIECPRIFKHEMVHKGWNISTCFNFDLNRGASKKKLCSRMPFLALSKIVSPPCKRQWTGAVRGGLEKNW